MVGTFYITTYGTRWKTIAVIAAGVLGIAALLVLFVVTALSAVVQGLIFARACVVAEAYDTNGGQPLGGVECLCYLATVHEDPQVLGPPAEECPWLTAGHEEQSHWVVVGETDENGRIVARFECGHCVYERRTLPWLRIELDRGTIIVLLWKEGYRFARFDCPIPGSRFAVDLGKVYLERDNGRDSDELASGRVRDGEGLGSVRLVTRDAEGGGFRGGTFKGRVVTSTDDPASSECAPGVGKQ